MSQKTMFRSCFVGLFAAFAYLSAAPANAQPEMAEGESLSQETTDPDDSELEEDEYERDEKEIDVSETVESPSDESDHRQPEPLPAKDVYEERGHDAPELPRDETGQPKRRRNKGSYIPDDLRVALGFGVAPGANLFHSGQIDPSPSLAARINFSERFVLEPVAEYAVFKVKDVKASYRIEFQLLAKYSFIRRKRTRFYGLAGPAFGYQRSGIDYKAVDLSLLGGFGGEFFFSANWSISLDIISPLLVYRWHKDWDDKGWALRSSIQTTTVRPSLHLYF